MAQKIESKMTLYEMSKQLAAQERPMDPILFNQNMIGVASDFAGSKYLMLLCHDRRDYTIFHLASPQTKDLARELAETLVNRGKVLVIDKQKDGAWEIWIRDIDTNENFAYYLFNYDHGVVEVEGK